jgi:hypothetical protein
MIACRIKLSIGGVEMEKLQLPEVLELAACLESLKSDICDDYIAEGDDLPGIDITLACDSRGYAVQTGDNSYSGSAYSYRHWGVGRLYRDTDCMELAGGLINQCRDLAEDWD